MKVLFLDIDGVLNSHQSIRAQFRRGGKCASGRDMPFCEISCSNLDEILARIPDLHIVVSSTWRIGRTLEELKKDLRGTGIAATRIIGMTPSGRMSYRARGNEIQEYMDDLVADGWEAVTQFVIVDDNSDMVHLADHLVQTDGRMGLMWDKAVEIMKRFGLSEREAGDGEIL